MAELSPAAQAVLDTWLSSERGERMLGDPACLAAALRVAAYQVAPARPSLDSCCEHWEQGIRHKLLAITAELEAANA